MDEKTKGMKDLKLCGEQINLTSRTRFFEDIKKSDLNKFRPHSALHTSNKIKAEYGRRPFSAGTLPTSPKLQSFLRYTNTERSNSHSAKSNDSFKESSSVYGADESTLLFEKLINDPIVRNGDKRYSVSKRRQHYDNASEHGSVDTCTSLGTKIKAKAQTFDRLGVVDDCYEISGNSIKLKKNKPQMNWTKDEIVRSSFSYGEKQEDCNPKLSVFVPNVKEENTSSGVSSSSDVYNFNGKKNQSDSKSSESPTLKYNSDYNEPTRSDYRLESINKEDSVHSNLAGRVSFGKSHFQNDPSSARDYNDLYTAFNTQLSLVEEESSQDSDISSKYTALSYATKIKERQLSEDDSRKYSLRVFKENSSRFDPSKNMFERSKFVDAQIKIEESNDGYIKDNLRSNSEYLISKYNEIKSTKLDEDKFKTLEEKYRNEKNENLREKDKINSYSYLKNYELEQSVNNSNDFTDTSKVKLENKYSSNITNHRESPKYRNEYVDEISFSTSNQTNDEFKLQPNIMSTPKVCFEMKDSKYDNEKEPPKSQILFTIPEILIDEIPEKDYGTEKNIKDEVKNSIDVNELQRSHSNSEEFKDSENTLKYPYYLEKNETKEYTSKVIEEYKKEISNINDLHDLTIRDLRKKCNDLKEYINDDSLENTPKKYMMTSTEEEDIDEKVISEFSRPQNIIVDQDIHSKSHKDNQKQHLIHFQRNNVYEMNLNSNESSIIDSKQYTEDNKCQIPKPKLKRKTKKKEPHHKPKSFNIRNKTENKHALPKKTGELKRVPDNASSRKINKGIMKFKAQKIALAKNSTRINKFYADYDKDIISWMASRVDSPLEEKSELNSRSNSNEKIKIYPRNNIHRNTVHFENDIVPILKNNTISYPKTPVVSNDSIGSTLDTLERKTSPKNLFSMDNIKLGQSNELNSSANEFMTCLSSIEVDLIDEDSAELNDLIHNDDLTTNMFSVLNDFSFKNELQTENKGNMNAKLNEEQDDNMTADYRDILKFLEKVEKSTNEDMSSLSHNQSPYAMKIEELMDLGKAELAHRAVVGTIAANKAATAAAGLREALVKAAKASAARLKAVKATAKHQTSVAAVQASQSLERHQKFIEQLVNEKKALTERIEQLATAAANAETRRDRGAKIAAERLQLELRNQRQRLSAAHQRDKQAWLKHHTQKIKEMTIKGLESELHEIEKKHSEQINKLQKEKELAIEKLQEQHSKDIRKLKDFMNQQLEDAIDKERLLGCERLEKKRVEWEVALAEATERADQEAKDAARRAEEHVRNARSQAEIWKIEQEKELSKQKAILEKQINEKRATLMEDFSNLKDKLLKELEEHKEEYDKNQSLVVKNKELEIRATMRRERDREIEKAIDCMELEAQEERREMQDTLRRIKEKYENDIHILEESEKLANERCKEIRDQLREVQELYANSQITITQLEGKLKQAEEVQSQNVYHNEMLVKAAETKGQENLEELRAEMHLLQQQHKEEMHKLFAKVKMVVARKDDAVTLARREVTNLRERCMRLEARNTPNY